MAVEERICAAILAKRVLRIEYHERIRIIEPHLLGEYADGRTFLTAWLLRYEHTSTRAEGWQNYTVGEIETLEDMPAYFAPRPTFNPGGDARVGRIRCAVSLVKLVE